MALLPEERRWRSKATWAMRCRSEAVTSRRCFSERDKGQSMTFNLAFFAIGNDSKEAVDPLENEPQAIGIMN